MATDTKTLRTGYRVRFAADQRLDREDALGLQELVYSYVSEALGGVMGGVQGPLANPAFPVGGSLSLLTLDASSPSAAIIGGPGGAGTPAMLMHTHEVTPGDFELEVLRYDPSLSGQQTTVDVSGIPAGVDYILWCQRVSVDTDADTRRKWDSSGASEVVFSHATRERYRLEFQVTSGSSPDPSDADWFPIGSINGTTYRITTYHPFDAAEFGAARWSAHLTDTTFGAVEGSDYSSGLGVIQALRLLASRVQDIMSTTGNYPFHRMPTLSNGGLVELNAAVDDAAADALAATVQVAEKTAAGHIYGSVVVEWSDTLARWVLAAGSTGATLTHVSAWSFRLDWLTTVTPWEDSDGDGVADLPVASSMNNFFTMTEVGIRDINSSDPSQTPKVYATAQSYDFRGFAAVGGAQGLTSTRVDVIPFHELASLPSTPVTPSGTPSSIAGSGDLYPAVKVMLIRK